MCPHGTVNDPTLDGKLMCASVYLKAVDLDGKEWPLKIKKVTAGQLTFDGGKKEDKFLVTFERGKKTFVLNKTNIRSIAKATGEGEARNWPGYTITLYPTRCKGKEGKMVDCIRVREHAPPQRPPASAPAQPEPEPPQGQDPWHGEADTDTDIPMDERSSDE